MKNNFNLNNVNFQPQIRNIQKYSFIERILIFTLFGYFIEGFMLIRVLEVALDDIPKFWCFLLPYPEFLIEILSVNILIGIFASIWFFTSYNKSIIFTSKHKLLLISPFLQLAIWVLIIFFTVKYV